MKLSVTVPVVLIALFLAGCGGGSGGGSAATSKVGQDQTLFNNKSTAPITQPSKNAAVATIDTAWIGLRGKSMASQAQTLVSQMSKMPQFQQGGITTDGCAWGRFTDGSPVVFLTNDPAIAVSPSIRPKGVSVPTVKKSVTAKQFDNELPASNVAYVFNSLEPLRNSPAPTIAQELSTAGYTVTSLSGSLSDWATVQNAGLLLNSSHGLEFDDNIYITTSDLQSATLDTLYAPQIAANNILRTEGESLDGSAAGSHTIDDYSFDYGYLNSLPAARSMFSTSSLFYSLSCSGAAPVASLASFMEVHCGLGVYLGWSNSVFGPDSNENASFFFDRTLGLDKVAPIDPDNPPPSPWSSVYGLMSDTQHQDGTPSNMNTSHPDDDETPANFVILDNAAGSTSLVTLIPSISSAETDSDSGTLTLDGYFGSAPGSVLASGDYLTIKSWTQNTITTDLPTESGPLIVHGASAANGYLISNAYHVAFSGNYHGTYSGTASDGSSVSGTFTLQIDDSGTITGSAGSVALTGSVNNSTGAVQFGSGAGAHVQASYTGTFVKTNTTITGSGDWTSVTTNSGSTVSSSGTWTTT